MSNWKWKFYEFKYSVTKPFSEIKRVVSQFFETEYFYRWKHTTYPWFDDEGNYKPSKVRNVYHLNNTWDGPGAIFGILDDKLFHMYINKREWSSSLDRYLNSSDVNEYGTEEEKVWAFKKLVKESLEDDLDDDPRYHFKRNYRKKYYAKRANLVICEIKVDESESADGYAAYQISRYVHKEPDTNFDIYRLEKVVRKATGEAWFCIQTEDLKESGKIEARARPKIKSETCTILDLGSDLDWKKVQEYFNENKIDVNVVERTLTDNYGSGSVEVSPKEFKGLSDKLKEHMRGRIVGLHQIYSIRKRLDKISEMDIMVTEPYKSEYEKIGLMDSKVKRQKAFNELEDRMEKDRIEMATEIMSDIFKFQEWIE